MQQAPWTDAGLFDQVVRAGEYRRRNGEAECLRRFHINHQLILGRCLHVERRPRGPSRLRPHVRAMECPGCRHANREGARFCGACGAPLPVLCQKCGAPNPSAASFCDDCGARLTGPAAAAVKPLSPSAATAALGSLVIGLHGNVAVDTTGSNQSVHSRGSSGSWAKSAGLDTGTGSTMRPRRGANSSCCSLKNTSEATLWGS